MHKKYPTGLIVFAVLISVLVLLIYCFNLPVWFLSVCGLIAAWCPVLIVLLSGKESETSIATVQLAEQQYMEICWSGRIYPYFSPHNYNWPMVK